MGKLNKTIDLTKFLKNKIVQAIMNILLGISAGSLTLVLLDDKGYEFLNIVLPLLSFAIIEFAAFKFKLLKKLYGEGIGTVRLIISAILGTFTSYVFFRNMPNYVSNANELAIFTLLAIPAITAFLYWFYGKLVNYIKKYIKTMDKVEKYFLIVAGVVLIIGISIIDAKTSLFNYGVLKEEYYDYKIISTENIEEDDIRITNRIKQLYLTNNYDIVSTTDSPILLNFDVFSNVTAKENDFKNPLFGVFSLPFSIIPKAISLIIPMANIYALLLSIVHGALVFIAFTLLARLMKLKGVLKALFLTIISIVFPTLLFLTNTEQYAISVFYLIVFIYMVVNNVKDKDMAYIMATGSTLTTGILFPLLLEKANIKQGIKNIFFTFLKCMAIFIISARIVLFMPGQMIENADGLKQYSSIAQMQNFRKYTNFAQNILLGPEIKEEISLFSAKTIKTDQYKVTFQTSRPAIRLVDTDKLNIAGIVILALTVLGFILNRKDKFMQICFAWVIFSIILLGVMGWGVPEDGLILYSFYFAWAFICLMFKGIEKMLTKVPKIRNTVYGLAIAAMLVVNISTIVKMVEFGIKYYS